MTSLLSSSVQGISSISQRINQVNTSHFRLCMVKTVGTVVGTVGTISLMSATYSQGVIPTMAAIALGSVGTLTGVGVNLAADYVHKRLTVQVLEDVELLKKKEGEGEGGGGDDGSTTQRGGVGSLVESLEVVWNPTRVLSLMGLGDNMVVLSQTLKLLQVHALLVRMFQMNTKLLIKVAYYKTKQPNPLNAAIRRWATSHAFSQGLKWVALLSTGLIILIDIALIIGVWKESYNVTPPALPSPGVVDKQLKDQDPQQE